MPVPNSRETLKQYCLRNLGDPVIKINVEDTQLEDRIDEAFQKYQEQHYDSTQDTWLAYKLTQADIDNGYLTISDDILIVEETINLSEVIDNNDIFSYQYQVALQNLSPFQTLDMINYFMTMTNIQQAYDLVNSAPRLHHTRHMNRVELFEDLSQLPVDTVIALHVHKIIDPDEFTKVYNDYWLKKYVTALFKRQWGNNMKKHGEIELLGGVKVNGQQFYDEALEEIAQLEEELESRYSEPVNFFLG